MSKSLEDHISDLRDVMNIPNLDRITIPITRLDGKYLVPIYILEELLKMLERRIVIAIEAKNATKEKE